MANSEQVRAYIDKHYRGKGADFFLAAAGGHDRFCIVRQGLAKLDHGEVLEEARAFMAKHPNGPPRHM
jgi:hypothetical protein